MAWKMRCEYRGEYTDIQDDNNCNVFSLGEPVNCTREQAQARVDYLNKEQPVWFRTLIVPESYRTPVQGRLWGNDE